MQVKAKTWICVLVINAIAASIPGAVYARDPGINQPGAAGNVGRAGPGVDPGINQPGAAGNVGRDPGINQTGAAGTRRGVRR
jgi:hypothetical protein